MTSPTSEPEVVVAPGAEVGEGPSWDARHARLLWVDVLGRELHLFDPSSGRDTSIPRPVAVSAAIPADDGRVVLCEQGRITLLDLATSEEDELAPIEPDVSSNRTNDAKCDVRGRLWVGTMDFDGAAGRGSLYRLDPGGPCRVIPGTSISNGIAWSPDSSTMYFIDSLSGGVDAYAYDVDTGQIGNRRRLIDVPASEGLPDGLCVDRDGFLWFGMWGGASVRRHAPDGRADRVVRLPTPNVTSCCFGDRDLTSLYVTTARADPPDAYGSAVFRVDPGAAGLPTNVFRRDSDRAPAPATSSNGPGATQR